MYAQYEQTMLLRGIGRRRPPQASAPAVDAAELIGSALSVFATDPDLLDGQRARIRHVLVDDAQHLDPQAAWLIRLIGTGAESTIITADTDQSVFDSAVPRPGLPTTSSTRDRRVTSCWTATSRRRSDQRGGRRTGRTAARRTAAPTRAPSPTMVPTRMWTRPRRR